MGIHYFNVGIYFKNKFLYDIEYINFDEPFLKVIHQGMILGEDGEKMSKSKGNTINPTNYEPQLLKMYLMFINHYFEGGKWQDSGYKGVERFRNRLFKWLDSSEEIGSENYPNILFFKERVIKYFEAWKTNKVVSEWMIFFNKNQHLVLNHKQSQTLKEFFNVCF